jgi:hypothetical protein
MRSVLFFLDCLTLEDGTVRLSQNVDRELPFYARKIPNACRSRLHRGGSLKPRKSTSSFGRFTPEKQPPSNLWVRGPTGFIVDPGVLETTPPAANQTPLSSNPSPATLLMYPNRSYTAGKRTSPNIM